MRALSLPTEAERSRRSLGRLVGAWPVWLHRIGLGRMVGRRYAVISSTGRRSGMPRRAAVMVLREDRQTGEIFVVAGDRLTHWYRNVREAPATEIWQAGRRYRPLQRLLSTEAIADLLVAIRRERPREARIQSAFFGWPWPATPGQLRGLASSLGGVAFRSRPRAAAVGSAGKRAWPRPEIHFCEEYPTLANLQRGRLITFPATVFLASETWPEFDRARAILRDVNPMLTAAWWPVPEKSRAFSVFCEPTEIAAAADALAAAPPGMVLLDLELPVWTPGRMLRAPWALRAAREELDRLFAAATARHEVWTAEWPPTAPGRVLHWLRIALPQASLRVYMLYSSLLPQWWRRLLIGRLRRRFRAQATGIAVGVLATGIAGDERILSIAAFERDLREAVQLGAAATVVYRVGGLEPAHVKAIDDVFGPLRSAPVRAA